MKMPPELAAHRVRAALGREPQDRLEAAVVLETWGVSTEHALAVAGPGAGTDPGAPPPVRPDWMTDDDGPRRRWEALWLCLAVLAGVAWTEPVLDRLSTSGAQTAWRLALPVAFFLQWFVRRRYLVGPGLGRLRGDRTTRWWVPLLVVGIVTATAASPVSAAVAGFVVVWTLSTPLVHGRWGPAYVVSLAGGAACADLMPGLAVTTIVGTEIALVVALLAVATWSDRSVRTGPLPSSPALASAAVGAMFGGIIALVPFPVDGRVEVLCAALVPQMLGGTAWYAVLDLLWPLLRNRSYGIVVTGTPRLGLAGAARLLLLRAGVAYLGCTTATSAALLVVAHATHGTWAASHGTFVEFAAIGLAGVTVGSLDALGRTRQALALTAATVAVSAAATGMARPGYDIAVQMTSVAALAVSGYLMLHLLLGEPERTYAQNF